MFERIIYVLLKKYLSKNNIPSTNQFGFCEKSSTFMAILVMVDKVTEAIDSKTCAFGIFIDLAKAFDMVNYGILQ